MVDAQNDRLAVDDEMLLAVLQSGFNDPGETLGPIVPAASDQPYPIGVAFNTQAVAIELDFVKPAGLEGTLVPVVGKQTQTIARL